MKGRIFEAEHTRPHLITCPTVPKIPLASKGASTHDRSDRYRFQRHGSSSSVIARL